MKNLKFDPKKTQVLGIMTMMFTILSFNVSQAKTVNEKKKTITKEVQVNPTTVMAVDHDFGDIYIEEYQGDVAKIVADITVRGEENVNLDDIISKYEIDVKERGGKVEVNSSFNNF